MHNDKTVEGLAKCLITANREGRPIIPVVGAGISADSGFPVLRSIVRYFGKLRAYIDRRLWLPATTIITAGAAAERDPLAKLGEAYKNRPWEFVRDFGWPDRFQLNEDLLTSIGRSPMDGAVQTGLDALLTDSSLGWKMQLLEKRRTAITARVNQSSKQEIGNLSDRFNRMRLARSATSVVRRRLKKLETDLKVEWAQEFYHLEQDLRQELIRLEDGRSVAMDLVGDWKRMILEFTRFRGDDADALFARFARGREPNLAHRYLAFLCRRLNVPVIFTMNFDPFIEQVLQEEGLRPRTFAMEHGLTLPPSSLVREQLAVIKMHGSTHALLLDEQLDRPLSRDYLERFERIVGVDPLLLVIGCSGDDVRLLDLTRQVVDHVQRKNDRPRVAWLHFEPDPPSIVVNLGKNPNLFHFRRTKNIGGTLTHLYSAIDKLHPSSHTFYSTHFEQPFLLDDQSPAPVSASLDDTSGHLARFIRSKIRTHRCILAQTVSCTESANQDQYPEASGSRQLLWMGSSLPLGHRLIWVDLEAVHTLSAVAGSIIDQCRRYDANLAPCVLPQDDDADTDDAKVDNVITNALQRVVRALRRSRYFVAFDGLETYTWSPTSHHGDTHSTTLQQGKRRLQALVKLLARLSAEPLGESFFVVSVDYPRRRTGWGPSVEGLEPKDIEPLERGNAVDWNEYIGRKLKASDYLRYDRTFEQVEFTPGNHLQAARKWNPAMDDGARKRWALALSILATFRRTRPLALVHHLLRPVLGADNIDDFLQKNRDLIMFRTVEGGGIWFWRKLRDYIYSQQTDKTSTDKMRKLLASNPATDDYGEAVFQLLLNTTTHQLVARGWYGAAFIQSHDTFALLEYFYHRLASVRTLTKLIKLVETARGDALRSQQLERGRVAFHEVVKRASNPKDLRESFEIDEEFLTGPADMLEPLVWRHKEELHRLLRVWRKSEGALRAQVPAEQLLRWTDQFLHDDLKDRCHRVITDYPAQGVEVDAVKSQDAPGGVIAQLREYLEDFTAKVLMDRSDYSGCKRLRTAVTGAPKNLIASVANQLNRGQPSELPPETIRLGHHRLDLIGGDFRAAQEKARTVADLLPKAEKCAAELTASNGWKQWNNVMLQEGREVGLHELQLRGLHSLTNCYFRRVCVFSHDGFSGAPEMVRRNGKDALEGFDALEQADVAILAGNRIARLLSKPQAATPYSSTINAVVDGTLYLPYRDIFLIQQARHRWMKAANESASQRHMDRGKADELLVAVDDALCEFEKARAGLTGTNQLTLALTDLHAVEACLAHARIVLRYDSETPKRAEIDDRSKLARSRYETARGLLGRAQLALAGAQRNVIWWRFFFQLTAQYHSDRLLLGILNVFDAEEKIEKNFVSTKLGSYIHRFRRGLESVKNASELYLQSVDQNWIPRLWRELTLSAFVLGLVIWRLREESIFSEGLIPASASLPKKMFARQDIIDHVHRPLVWMMQAAGLDPSKQNLTRSYGLLYDAIPPAQKGKFRMPRDRLSSTATRGGHLFKKACRLRERVINYAASPP